MDERRQSIADLKKRIETYVRSLEGAREWLGEAALSDSRAESVLTKNSMRVNGSRWILSPPRPTLWRYVRIRSASRTPPRGGTLKKTLDTQRREILELRSVSGKRLWLRRGATAFTPFRTRIDARPPESRNRRRASRAGIG
jgi:hypothetical protein